MNGCELWEFWSNMKKLLNILDYVCLSASGIKLGTVWDPGICFSWVSRARMKWKFGGIEMFLGMMLRPMD